MPIVNFVIIISSIRKQNPIADKTDLEREIDRLMYEQYGLTDEKIAIMEGRT